jgi:molybdate transport system ATP-binding protein
MKPKSLLKLENVTARLRDRWIFPDTNWTIKAGEHWAILGPNGSGKSSLMRLLLNEIPAVRGRIIRTFDPEEFAIGYVAFELHDWFLKRADASGKSVKTRDVLLSSSSLSLAAAETARLIERLGLGKLLASDIRSLSTGEMRRVLIARALLKSPGLLILDEPFSGLDRQMRRQVADMIAAVAASGTQLILVVNRAEEILPCITHVVCVKDCKIFLLGTRDILTQETLTALYGMKRVSAKSGPMGEHVPSDGKILVRMKKVTVVYGTRTILDGVDWTIRRGEHWAVIGPNGAGKSTLVNLITGENLQGYGNEIYLFGRKKGTGEALWKTKRKIGAVSSHLQYSYRRDTPAREAVASGFFDSSGLYRALSAGQNQRVADWMDMLDIAHLAEKPFGRLSFGEKRMVAIARAVVKDPELLLLDEPCAGLDAANRLRVSDLVETIASRSRTVIVYVTHHPEEMPACITRVLRLDRPGKAHISSAERGGKHES